MKQIIAKVHWSNAGLLFQTALGMYTVQEMNSTGFEIQQIFSARNSNTQLEELLALCVKRKEEDAK